jgi:hypothetical protein
MEPVLLCTACDRVKPVDGFIESERMCIDCIQFLDALLEKSVEKKSVSETEIPNRRRSRSRSPRGERVEESKKRKGSASVSPASSQEKEEKWCFLGRLTSDIGDLELLRILTARYGPVKSLQRPERQKHYCFVLFVDLESAAKLMRDRLVLHGVKVNAKYHVPTPMGGESRQCVVHNLPRMSDADFRKVVENRFGKVSSFQPREVNGKKFGFLTFAELDSAVSLVTTNLWEVNGNVVYGLYKRGNQNEPPSHSRSLSPSRDQEKGNRILVRNLPQIGDLELLQLLEERYGAVESIQKPSPHKKFVFVKFFQASSAAKLVQDRWVVRGKRLYPSYCEAPKVSENRRCLIQNLPRNFPGLVKILQDRFGKILSFSQPQDQFCCFVQFEAIESARALIQTGLWEVRGRLVYGQYARAPGNQNEPPSRSPSRRRPRSCSQDRTDEESVKRIRPDDDGFRDFVLESTEVLLQSAESPVSDRVVLHRTCDDAQRLEEEISQARKHVAMMESVLVEERKRWTMVLSELMKQIEEEKRAWAKGMNKLQRAAKIQK